MQLRRLLAATFVLGSIAAVTIPVAEAAPITTWRTRPTGQDSVGKCTRRAFTAVKNAGMDGKSSGEAGVYGYNGPTSVTVLCMQNGGLAVVFCDADFGSNGRSLMQMCDTVSRQMAP